MYATGCAPEPTSRGTAAVESQGPPSIVLISLDTTRADRIGAYGYSSGTTPNLDRIAAGGVVFERAITTVPVTLPAHASLMTGRLPHRHGVRDNGIYRLPDELPVLAERFAAAGYRTVAAVGAEVLDRQYGLARGFEVYDDRIVQTAGLAIPERSAAEVTDAALTAMRGVEEPFLLFVHYFDPHADYAPPEPFRSRFGRPYDGEIAYVDDQVGRLLLGIAGPETVVMVVADHGESLGEHGEPAHGVFLYDSTLRVPMILSAPGRVVAGRRVSDLASLVDVMPTLIALAGLPPAADVDGRSWLDELTGRADAAAPDRWLALESELPYNSYGWAPLHGLTDGRTKWIGAPAPELYDLRSDPGESQNLAAGRPDESLRLQTIWREIAAEDRRAPPPGDSLDPAQAARLGRLSSLGYVAAPGRERPTGEELPDPKTMIDTLETIKRARGEMVDGRPGEAIRRLEGVVARAAGNLSALTLLGSARILVGDFAGAVEALEVAAGLSPHNADVFYNLGIAQASLGRSDQAEKAWQQTLAISPRFAEAAANLIDLLESQGRAEEAADVLTRARAAGLAGGLFDYLEARIAVRSGDIPRARRLLQSALSTGLPAPVQQDARRLAMELGP